MGWITDCRVPPKCPKCGGKFYLHRVYTPATGEPFATTEWRCVACKYKVRILDRGEHK